MERRVLFVVGVNPDASLIYAVHTLPVKKVREGKNQVFNAKKTGYQRGLSTKQKCFSRKILNKDIKTLISSENPGLS